MRTIIVATLVAMMTSAASASGKQQTTLEGAVLQIVPKGYEVMFVKGVDVERRVDLNHHIGAWQQRLSAIASRANAIAEIDEAANSVRIIAVAATPSSAHQEKQEQKAGITPNQSGSQYAMSAKQGELLSVALRRALQRYGYTLVWNLKTDLEASIEYSQVQASIEELCNSIMRDYQLVGTLFLKNRVLVVTDPAIKE